MDSVSSGVLMPIINLYSVYNLISASIMYLRSSAS